MSAQRSVLSSEGRRIVICDYNALLLSVTGLLRMSRYCVFQAHDGHAAEELCVELPDIALLTRPVRRATWWQDRQVSAEVS